LTNLKGLTNIGISGLYNLTYLDINKCPNFSDSALFKLVNMKEIGIATNDRISNEPLEKMVNLRKIF
jgi:hypothetical protein